MELFGHDIHELPFGGAAEQLQQRRATASLVRELGDHYSGYHATLAAELARVRRPTAPKFDGIEAGLARFDAYVEEWTHVERLVAAEAVLRACAAYRRGDAPLQAQLPADGPPLVEGDLLVSA